MSLFLLAGGREDWTPREPVLDTRPPKPTGGTAKASVYQLRICEAVDCETEFRSRGPQHTTCSFPCANSLRRRVRGS